MTKAVKGLSVRAPWWWFILYAGKDIENRGWPTSFRGTVYLHAAKWWVRSEGMADIHEAFLCCPLSLRLQLLPMLCVDMFSSSPHRGCIVGTVDIVDCVSKSASPWFFGPYGFVLRNPVPFAKPIPFKGMLGFFDVPEGIEVSA